MGEDENVIFLARYYSTHLSRPRFFSELDRLVWDAIDREIYRGNRKISTVCQEMKYKLETVRYHAHSALDRLQVARRNLDEILREVEKDVGVDPTRHLAFTLENTCRVEFYDFFLVAHLEGLLIQTKGALDSLMAFYNIGFERNLFGFKSSGQRLLKDLENLGAGWVVYAEELRELISEAKDSWIDQLITYRDELIHRGQLRDLRCMLLPLSSKLTYTPDEVAPARMPDGVECEVYIKNTLHAIHDLCRSFYTVVFRKLRDQNSPGRIKPVDA